MRKIVEKKSGFTDPALRELLDRIDRGPSLVGVAGLQGSSKSLILAVIFDHIRKTILVVAPGEKESVHLKNDLSFFLGADCVIMYPAWDMLSVDLFAVQRAVEIARMEVLCRLSKGDPCVVVAPFSALVQKTLPSKALNDYIQTISIGDGIDRDTFVSRLLSGGYHQTTLVEQQGEFSVRGHVIDVFPPTSTDPLRMEFFGDDVESIRRFDPSSQRSKEEIIEFLLSPAREAIITEETTAVAINVMKRRINELELSKTTRNRLLETMTNRGAASINPLFAPLFYEAADAVSQTDIMGGRSILHGHPSFGLLTDFLPEGGIVAYDDLSSIRRSAEALENDIDRFLMKAASEEKFYLEKTSSFVTEKALFDQCSRSRQLDFRALDLKTDSPDDPAIVTFRAPRVEGLKKTMSAPTDDQGLLSPLIDNIRLWTSEGNLVVLACGGMEEIQRMSHLLVQYGLAPERLDGSFLPAVNRQENRGRFVLMEGRLSDHFALPGLGLVVISEETIFGKKVTRRKNRTSREGFFLLSFGDLKEGDFVVHTDHGIGLYRGLQKLTVEKTENDFLIVEYQDNDRLYLPVDRLDRLQRYMGPDGHVPRMDKLGGTSWETMKERVKKSVREVAEELVSIYAAREIMERDIFAPPDRVYDEFCSGFPYEETPDQTKAIEDIHLDLNDAKPMDRLICGDAGFGKTEVALRASFRAVMDGRQVAVLVPTTILAEQHYQTFSDRLKDYPVRVAVLNRIRTKSQQVEIVDGVNRGAVDIVIGTHRILQKDMIFKNLGLVIIDEEQRFGVTHKEKLKKLRTLVDVLTLTATPIPRTLHLSLVGIRDLTIINTPPEDRQPIKTHVLEFNEDVVAKAIRRELARGGQVFFIHDRIQSIFSMARFVEKLAPESRVGVVHGRMKGREIEDTMVKFVRKDYDILVCTTIVASGVDIPTANTIIINRADRFGLAQLYQLRGRVGRSREEAFAYLLVPKGAMLSRDAQKRLQVIMDFSEPGSGFRIASNDLEIRGAGSLLGESQSGHVSAVGYELYTELMERTIRELKGEKEPEEDLRPEIHLGLSAYIPEGYMADEHTRLLTYKKISLASTEEELLELRDGLMDSYGFVAPELDNLIEVIRIRNTLKQLKGKKMSYDGKKMSIAFHRDSPLDPEKLVELSRRKLKGMRLTPDFNLQVPMPDLTGADILAGAKELLFQLRG